MAEQLVRSFPELLVPRGPLSDPEFLGEGDFSRAFAVAGGWILRLSKHDQAASAQRREAQVMEELAPLLPLPVPRPDCRPDPLEPGTALSLHRGIPGRPLDMGAWLAEPPETRARLAGELGGFLRVLHGIDPARLEGCDLPQMDHGGSTAAVRRGLGPVLSGELRARVKAVLAGAPAPGPRSILHADLSPDHLLHDPSSKQITGIIDWGDVALGDPARDFIFLFEDWGPSFLEAVLEGYGESPGGAFHGRVLVYWLVDQAEWTLRAAEEGRTGEAAEGVDMLEAGIGEVERVRRG